MPWGLGVWGLIGAARAEPDDEVPPVATGPLSVAAVTIANGADNLSVYTPMFRTIGTVPSVVTVGVFAVLVAVWCLVSSWLGSHEKVVAVVERFGHWIVPVVFVVIGVVIIADSGVIGRILWRMSGGLGR